MSNAATANADSLPAPVKPAPTADFADWLSPILVKELRQGLKTRMFVSVFVLIQAVMIVIVGLQLISVSYGNISRSSTEGFDAFFWSVLWIPLIIIMPARGLNAISEEIKANTLDLVQLTRMTAFRIVLGKWVALVAQTLLLVASVLPYTVLRYFFGSVDIVTDLYTVGMLLIASLVLTAGAVALSSIHVVFRIMLVLIGIPALMSFIGIYSMARAFGGATTSLPEIGTAIVMVLISSAIYILFFLELASGKIAPLSENHIGRRRLIAMITALLAPIAFWLIDDIEIAAPWIASFGPLWAWSIFESLTEGTVGVPSLYTPFVKRGWLGRLAGRVFYPGWASGIVYTNILFLILCTYIITAVYMHDPGELNFDTLSISLPLIITAIIFPVIVLLLFPRMKQPGWLYILVQALFGLIFLVVMITAEVPGSTSEDAYKILAPFPACALMGMLATDFDTELLATYALVSLPACALICLYLAYRMIREFKVIGLLEKEAISQHA